MRLNGISDFMPTEGEMLYAHIESKQIYITRHQGKIFAGDDRCPHAGGILSKGFCKDGKIVCPLHRWSFDLETGQNIDGEGGYILTYPIKKEEAAYWIGLPMKKWWEFLFIFFYYLMSHFSPFFMV